MAKITKNDIIKQYFSLLSKILSIVKEINGREGFVPNEYKNSITKIFAILILLGYEYQEKGPNIIFKYENNEYRESKEAIEKYIDFNVINVKKEDYASLPKLVENNKNFSGNIQETPMTKDVEQLQILEQMDPLGLSENETVPSVQMEENLLFDKMTDLNIDNSQTIEDEQIVEDKRNNEEMIIEGLSLKSGDKEMTDPLNDETIVISETDKQAEEVKVIENIDEDKEVNNNVSSLIQEKEEPLPINGLFEKVPNLMDKIFEADSSVIFVPEMKETTETWLNDVFNNLVKDNDDSKQYENFIYNRHIIKLRTNEGLEKIIKFMVYPLEYQNNKIPVSILVISDYYGRLKYSYSEKRKIVEITVDDVDFMVSGKWIDGEFDSLIAPTSNVKENSVVSDINKIHTKDVYPKYFGKHIKRDNVTIDVFPVSNQNNKYGIVPSIALVKSNNNLKSFITEEDGKLIIPTHGKLYSFDTYWMGDGFHVTEL